MILKVGGSVRPQAEGWLVGGACRGFSLGDIAHARQEYGPLSVTHETRDRLDNNSVVTNIG